MFLKPHTLDTQCFSQINYNKGVAKRIYKGGFMSGDFETLEINQPKITYLKPGDNTEWLDKLINNIEDMKNKISKNS